MRNAAEARDTPMIDLKPPRADMRSEVLAGLRRQSKVIAPKFFYDARGSALFEKITALPEYYLTRTEIGIFRTHGEEMAREVGAGTVLIEFGSGSSAKIRMLLAALRPAAYLPVDISRERLAASAQALRREYPSLEVRPICADYSRPFEVPDGRTAGRRLAFFPGSSIGNFDPDAAIDFLANVYQVVGSRGQLLIGFDRKKDPAILDRAYDDVQGVTAAFNLNVLQHINAVLGADFDLEAFAHRARYDAARGRMEMYLVSRRDQVVHVGTERVRFRAGEAVHTESSYKYHVHEFDELARRAGFSPHRVWTDPRAWFAVALYRRS